MRTVGGDQGVGRDVGTVAGESTPRWLRPAWVRLLVLLPLFVGVTAAIGLTTSAVSGSVMGSVAVGVPLAFGGVWFYRVAVRRTEHRPVVELAWAGAFAGLLRGAALGGALFLAVIALIALAGGYRIEGFGSIEGLVAAFGVMGAVAVSEELLFRGVLFRLLEERAGTWWATVLSSVLFGLLHLLNPASSLWGALAVAAEAGLLLAAAYVATRSLWFPIGLHFAWNVAEGGVFGVGVSGSAGGQGGLLRAQSGGSALVGGGAFGPEATLPALVICLVVGSLFLRHAARHDRIRRRQIGRRQLAPGSATR